MDVAESADECVDEDVEDKDFLDETDDLLPPLLERCCLAHSMNR